MTTRSTWMLRLALLAVAGVLVILATRRDPRPQAPPAGAARDSGPAQQFSGLIRLSRSGIIIPAPHRHFEFEATYVAGIPRVTKEAVAQALSLIVRMEGAPDLQTPDDQAIMTLAKSYYDGSRVLQLAFQKVRAGGRHDGEIARTAHTCVIPDRFVVHPEIRATVPLLAASIYHELLHAVKCPEEMERAGVTDPGELAGREGLYDPCRDEPAAWAAGLRFFFALARAGKLPERISSEETSDAGLVQMLLESWQALLEDRFCEFYRERTSGHD